MVIRSCSHCFALEATWTYLGSEKNLFCTLPTSRVRVYSSMVSTNSEEQTRSMSQRYRCLLPTRWRHSAQSNSQVCFIFLLTLKRLCKQTYRRRLLSFTTRLMICIEPPFPHHSALPRHCRPELGPHGFLLIANRNGVLLRIAALVANFRDTSEDSLEDCFYRYGGSQFPTWVDL